MSSTFTLTELHTLVQMNWSNLVIRVYLGDEFQLISKDSKEIGPISLSNPQPNGIVLGGLASLQKQQQYSLPKLRLKCHAESVQCQILIFIKSNHF